MARLEQAVIMSREAQLSDAALFRKDLPKSGAYSALDIGIRLTNGATSAVNLDILDVIKHLSLVMNGNDYRFHIKGQDAFRLHWLKNGRPMPYSFDESGGAVQEVWFRMQFGRFLGDPLFGLNLDRFNNVQLQIDYDNTVWGAVAATTFATGTFTITVIAHQFPYASRPSFRGMMGVREFWTGTSAASGDEVEGLPSSNPVLAVAVSALEDNVAEATDITDILIGKDNFATRWIDGKWYNFQDMQNSGLDVREESYTLYGSNAGYRDTHIANTVSAQVLGRSMTVGA